MKILLLGKNGQVGWELSRSLLPIGEVVALDRSQCDLSKPETIPVTLQEHKPDVIVNATAYTAVDKAEEEEELAAVINGAAVGVIADEARKLGALLIHYSTDYVFDGTKLGAYVETDIARPISVYGNTKYQGEEAIRKSKCRHLIFRTSWVYASRGNNFVKTMLRLSAERDELKIVADQYGAPTNAELIADITALCLYAIPRNDVLEKDINGIYHLTSSGRASWYDFAKYVINRANSYGLEKRVSPKNILPISTDEYPLPAKRPANSKLDTQKLRETFGVYLPPWQFHADRMVDEILQQ